MANGVPYYNLPAPLDQKELGRYIESELRRVSAAIDWLWDPTYTASIGVPLNFSPSFSVASNALTMAIKGANGADPSTTNPVYFPLRSSTASSGLPVWRALTTALSLTISNGSTAGHNSGLKQYLYWYVIDNGGVLKPAFSSKFFGLSGIATTVAEGGAGAADSGTVMYSDAAYSNVPFLCLCYTEDTQTTAGAWAAAPSAVHLAPFTLPVISFSAIKSANQVAVATGTKITFPTENYDNGGLFDSATNYRITPPPGHLDMKASLRIGGTLADQSAYGVYVQKNGADIQASQQQASGVAQQFIVTVAFDDECNGIDYYDVVLKHTAAADPDIISGSGTYFHGSWSPGRS